MRRRSSTDPNEALELFLDAISNVFGGVLFVALLVVLMLQVTTKTPAQTPTPEAPDMTEQLSRLQNMVADQDAVASLITLTAQHSQLQADVDTVLDEARTKQQREATAVAALQELARQSAEAREAVRGAEEALEAARAKRDGLVRLPQFKPSAKREAPWLIEGGRVAPLLRFDAQGSLIGPNIEAIQVHPGDRVSLQNETGVMLDANNVAAVARTLTQGLSPQEHFISLAVWDDSFAEAAALRDALVAAGFEYGLVLLKKGETVATGAQGGVQ